MAPATQKACVVPEEKQPWKIIDSSVPVPGPKEVLVKILSAAINPADAYIQKFGAPFIQSYPFYGGLDGAGIVEEVGSEVTNVAKGDKILFPGGFDKPRATFQQYNIVPADNTAKIPENITFDQAAAVPLGLATVATGIWAHHPEAQSVDFPAPWEEGGTTKFVGQAALVIGGSSSVGQYAIQMAKLQGFSPIIATASPRHEIYLKSIGATHVIDRSLSSELILAEIPKLTGGKSVVYAYAAISTDEMQHLAYDAVAPGGALVVTQPRSHAVLAEKEARDGGSKKIARPFASFSLPGNKKLGEELYSRLSEWLRAGILVPNRVEVLPGGLSAIAEASERMCRGEVSGVKLIVHPQEAA